MGSLFRNHSPATILHDKKDTQAAILVRGRTRLSPQRPDDARPGTRLLPQPGPSRYKSRNPGTPIRNRDGGIADRTSHNAILFPGSDLHRPPGCFRDTPHYEGENETYIEASVENSSSILYDKEIRNKPRTRRTKRNV